MSGAITLPGLETPALDAVRETVWGIDPSSLRVSVGILRPDELADWRTCSLAKRTGMAKDREAWWFGDAGRRLTRFFRAIMDDLGAPAHVRLEEPFGAGKVTVHPTSQRAFGVTLAALEYAAPGVPVSLVGPMTWKMLALGEGHGRAEKPEIMEWAAGACRYSGGLQDEADALGIAASWAVDRARGAA